MKETVSRIPASFAAVIGNCVVNEADECLHPFPSIAHVQIPFLSYFPDSHSLPPSCNAFDQAFCLFPTTSHLKEWHLHPVWYCHPRISNGDRLPPRTIWAAAGKAQTQEKQAMQFPQPGLSSQEELLCKLPLDPEITNLQTVRQSGYYLFWWHIAPRCWACSGCLAIEFMERSNWIQLC